MTDLYKQVLSAYGEKLYPLSWNETENSFVCMVNAGESDMLLAGDSTLAFAGEKTELGILAPLTHENACVLRAAFPFTAPRHVLPMEKTMGVGDRLGNCTVGHIAAFRAHPELMPIFAQQSIRELNLTNRTFENVLDCVSFAVYREGFKSGFGADGDHLKTTAEVDYALSCGYTMLTLDCSEHIRNDITDENCDSLYTPHPELEALYSGKTFEIGEGYSVTFDPHEFRKNVLIYLDAIEFADSIYHSKLKTDGDDRADFEMSIDETMTPTTPAQHFFVASELKRRDVNVITVAPRFCGEFQKGIDYIGNLAQFDEELKIHAAIARHFGYKLSIHSGSDKFSVFPSIGRETRGNFHVKTAGTNWLQAMLLVANVDPALYREVHAYALTVFSEATKYYHVTTNLANIPALDTLTDAQLPWLFKNNDSRQLIHITYGLILNAKDAAGAPLFRDRLYRVWRENEKQLSEYVSAHICRHMDLLLGK